VDDVLSVWKNIAFANIVVRIIVKQQERRWQRVKVLRAGRFTTENHRWLSVKLLRASVENNKWKLVRSSRDAGASVRSISPSSSSTANHLSQRNQIFLSVCMSCTRTRCKNQPIKKQFKERTLVDENIERKLYWKKNITFLRGIRLERCLY
jgi:predicted Zn-dependent protease